MDFSQSGLIHLRLCDFPEWASPYTWVWALNSGAASPLRGALSETLDLIAIYIQKNRVRDNTDAAAAATSALFLFLPSFGITSDGDGCGGFGLESCGRTLPSFQLSSFLYLVVHFCCPSLVWGILGAVVLLQMRTQVLMGNLRLRHLCDVTPFSPWRSDAYSVRPYGPLICDLSVCADFWFRFVFAVRRWCDDRIVSLLVWLAAMMAQTVLALSDHLLRDLISITIEPSS